MSYPKFLYHKALAPDGRVISSAEQEAALDPGWVDTPAAFDAGYVTPEPVLDTKGHVASAPTPGYVYKPFPSFRYLRDGTTCVVNTQDEADALDPQVWKDTPDSAGFPDDAPPSTKGMGHAAAPPSTPPPGASRADVQKVDLYTATVATIAAKVATMDDVAALQVVQGFELTNPTGARVGVLKAVEKRLVQLGAAPPPAEKT